MTLVSATQAIAASDPIGIDPSPIGVARRSGEYRVIALEPIQPGTRLMRIDGLFVDKPSRYSVQLGIDIHVEPPAGLEQHDDPERCRWRYLNHSCDPNAAIVGRQLVSLREISVWEEISFDYNTTELEMASPFLCRCGHCAGRSIRGFRHLGPEEQLRLAPRLASYLRALLPGAAARGTRG